MDKSAILVVSFGTTEEKALEKTIGAVERAVAGQKQGTVRRAFTGTMVLQRLRRRGIAPDTPAEALEKLKTEGYRQVTVLPTFLAPGGEYRRLLEQAAPWKACFDRLTVLPPLLGSPEAVRRLGRILETHYPPEPGEAVLFMGHGSDGEGNECYRELAASFEKTGMYVALLKGTPAFETALESILAAGHRAVCLVPLMLSAGVHAAQQMAGSGPDSWASRCAAAGLHVRCRMTGLGEWEAVQQLYAAALRQEECL